jgi:membrane protein DedA with SNARE-associated domain
LLDLITDFATWIETLPPVGILLVLGIVAYIENVLPPIPGDMIIVLGGYLAGLGLVSFLGLVVVCSLGGLLGFLTMFFIGRWIGDVALNTDRYKWLPRGPVDRVRGWLFRYGYRVVLANRFLSGARSVIALMVGAARMDVLRTSVFAGISATIWTVLIAYGGFVVGDNWPLVADYLIAYGRFVTAILVVVGAFFAGRAVYRSQSRREARQENAKTPSQADRTADPH